MLVHPEKTWIRLDFSLAESQSTNGTVCGMSNSAAASKENNLDLETFVLQYEKEQK